MNKEYSKIFEEIEDEIQASLENPNGISIHQRRLSFMLSLGLVNFTIKTFVFQ